MNETFEIDLTAIKPKFRMPDILMHPNIPGAVHGLNPRTVLGRRWWDSKRKEAYAENNDCCWACGTYQGDDPVHPGLEAHESYNIYYHAGILELRRIVALCYSCHNFIHSGRLRMIWQDGEVSTEDARYILESRMQMLRDAHLEPFYGTLAVYYHIVKNMPYHSALQQVHDEGMDLVARSLPMPRKYWMLVVGTTVYDVYGRRIFDANEIEPDS